MLALLMIRVASFLVSTADLSQWWLKGATNDTARHAAGWEPGKDFQDWSNLAGSCLMLALLQPQKFGLPCPSVALRWPSKDMEWLLGVHCQISSAPQRSGKGPNNRRCNFVEGLNNYFSETHQCARKHDLELVWKLFSRALRLLQSKSLELSHQEQVKMAFEVEELFH